ncbi:hypothetical protein [Comamonas serinivorans]|uniref:hypothetical protein n=1 Tax=Comamonas serinivorans TaxID=1082851 RepID=UPI00196A6982|nr:hypothetical protein [Comamonas serinivorans]
MGTVPRRTPLIQPDMRVSARRCIADLGETREPLALALLASRARGAARLARPFTTPDRLCGNPDSMGQARA